MALRAWIRGPQSQKEAFRWTAGTFRFSAAELMLSIAMLTADVPMDSKRLVNCGERRDKERG